MKKWWKYVMMSMAMLLAFTSCGDDEDYFRYGDFMYDMVTYMGVEDGCAVFTYQAYNDSPLITLVANNYGESTLKKGQRLLLNYEVAEDFGNNHKVVQVKGVSRVNTDTIQVVKASRLETLKMDEMRIKSVWRTGNYLNVRCEVQYTDRPRYLYLATTGEMDADGVVNCYQIQDLKDGVPYYWLETYISYYIEPAMAVDGCKMLKYNVNNETAKWYEFKISK